MKIFIGCKEATLYIIRNEENNLSLAERSKLSIHLFLCKFCRLFEKQSRFISNNFRNIIVEKHFTQIEKENLIKLIKSSIE